MSSLKETELVRQAQAGSPEAGSQLFRLYWSGTWRAAYAIVGRRALADEIAQEAFVRAFGALSDFDASRPFAPWVKRIAVNLAIDELRREHWLVEGETAEVAREQPVSIEDVRDGDAVFAAVRRLSPSKRLVIILRYWLDYSIAEIAEALEIPNGTVMSRLSRTLSELRSELEAVHVE